jgi:hypothetical protein
MRLRSWMKKLTKYQMDGDLGAIEHFTGRQVFANCKQDYRPNLAGQRASAHGPAMRQASAFVMQLLLARP